MLNHNKKNLAGGYMCVTCKANKGNRIEMADKETEMSNSYANFATQTDSIVFGNFIEINNKSVESEQNEQEPFDKTCPICGEAFKEDVDFAEFQSHVECHFIGLTAAD